MIYRTRLIYLLALVFLYQHAALRGQERPASSIREEVLSLKTYPFTDPNPVPYFHSSRNIYPNFLMEGYTTRGEERDWNFVIMENAYIRVYILPAVGGKIWGAVEKSTGEEFIYKNEVIKFRNVAMRGPWTCGGIELNFGLIGHTPSTASMVDYTLEEHEDGSVCCVVGTMDLTSRTLWRVRITLPPDKAWFKTHASWYNPTELEQSYYNWMTGTAFARKDLEFIVPGDQYLKHSGEAKPYPIDGAGRNLAFYRENAFGKNKSYHVVGSDRNFFGGYYHDKEFGFGHWAPKEAMPGQKIWMWTQSREGEIWTDLMTDSDGMHIEFQAGRMYNQYGFDRSEERNPISQAGFTPGVYDHWEEIWFPIKGIGGMEDAGPVGVLNVEQGEPGLLEIGIHALAPLKEILRVKQGSRLIFSRELSMDPMEIRTIQVRLEDNGLEREVILGDNLLYYSSDPEKFLINRSFENTRLPLSDMQELFIEAIEAYRTRKYSRAQAAYNKMAEKDPYDFRVLSGQAKCHYRMGQFEEALEYANTILRQDTYHSEGNYLAGITYRAMGDALNARECLGWAARDLRYRTSAFTQIAELLLSDGRLVQAAGYLEQALDYNQYNLNALAAAAVIRRLQEQHEEARKIIQRMLEIDPLYHFARYEQVLADGGTGAVETFAAGVKNEFRNEHFMELALHYLRLGRRKEALHLFEMASGDPIAMLWSAWLLKDEDPVQSTASIRKAAGTSPAFVFPHRLESLQVLNWATSLYPDWKFLYYQGLTLMAVSDREAARESFLACGYRPDFAPFYLSRAEHFHREDRQAALADLRRAVEVDPSGWRSLFRLTEYGLKHGKLDLASKASSENMALHGDNFRVGVLHARLLLAQGHYQECLDLLADLTVLPAEDAQLPRQIYEEANLLLALEQIGEGDCKSALTTLEASLLWPENLGVGEPYEFDARKQHMLMAYCHAHTGNRGQARNYLEQACSDRFKGHPNDVLSILALKELGRTVQAETWMNEMHKGTQGAWMMQMLNGNFSTGYDASGKDHGDSLVILNKICKQVREGFLRQ